MERKAKEKVVEELGDRLNRAGALFLAEYSGMSVAQISKLRRELDNVGGEFKVAKNTLLKIAAAGTQAEVLKDEFAGPNAVISLPDADTNLGPLCTSPNTKTDPATCNE